MPEDEAITQNLETHSRPKQRFYSFVNEKKPNKPASLKECIESE